MSISSALTSGGLVRRRRVLLFAVLLFGFLYFCGVPSLPESLKDAGYSALSRASIAHLVKSKASPKVKVDEIYGLLHLVTSEPENDLSQIEGVNGSTPIDMIAYAGGNESLDWGKQVKLMNLNHPIVVFSKSYCPYSRRAKYLLQSYDINPPPKVIEVDLRADSGIIKNILTRLTHHSTFPNIIIRGQSIGGSDNLQSLHVQQQLVKIIDEAGAEARNNGITKEIPT